MKRSRPICRLHQTDMSYSCLFHKSYWSYEINRCHVTASSHTRCSWLRQSRLVASSYRKTFLLLINPSFLHQLSIACVRFHYGSSWPTRAHRSSLTLVVTLGASSPAHQLLHILPSSPQTRDTNKTMKVNLPRGSKGRSCLMLNMIKATT